MFHGPREPLVPPQPATAEARPVRIGAVAYLNARPLTFCLPELDPSAQIVVDLPSRLADRLAAGELDVALIPSIEYFRNPGSAIVSDACVACRGPVRSIKLYGRVPPERIRTLALDEGSRTSAALTRIMLRERFGLEPQLESLPIGASAADCRADAVLVIGDRGLLPAEVSYQFTWDLGEQWFAWTGLPFVFAMWIARRSVALDGLDELLCAARDEGCRRFHQIARREAPILGLSEADCLSYLEDHLVFRLGPEEQQGLETFCRLAARHRLIPTGVPLVFHRQTA